MNSTNLKLRSRDWFGKDDRWGLAHRAWLRAEGFSERVFEGKPVIGICNSWSELNNCNAHLRQVAEAVKRGVWEAGGFPLASRLPPPGAGARCNYSARSRNCKCR